MIEDNSTKEQIYVATDAHFFPSKGFELACKIANAHEKSICFLLLAEDDMNLEATETTLTSWCQQNQKDAVCEVRFHILSVEDDFTDFMERNEAVNIIFELNEQSEYRNCKKALRLCRELRIPYYFIKSDQQVDFTKVLVPIGFLVEEREKGVFCSGMGRIFHSEIMLMPAKDYGSRAKQNTESIQKLMDKFSLPYHIISAEKDSFKIEKEAMKKAVELQAGLLMISASRDYGMDDILFGPKEQKVINKSTVPVMVINPRKDLYTLCT